jgi:TrmH family RNA methyltransferase
MGSIYHVPLYKVNLNEALRCLYDDGVICICGHLQGSERLPYPTDRCVIVVGNEGVGVAENNAALCAQVRLPMYGRAESLNASVAAALLMYEVAKAMYAKL